MIKNWVIRNLRARPRVCIFCGEPPRGKNKEHIIPKWLIELTGDPNRIINLGPFVSQALLEPEGDLFRSFSFDSFSFPSCARCNSEFSDLEGHAKKAFTSLLNAKSLSSPDIEAILSWFDKVRIGLWLGVYYYLDHNFWGVLPHFYIKDRVSTSDRALVIRRSHDRIPGIRFSGVNTPAFAHVPSCFTLIVNEWFLTNISYQFIVSEGAGFPYPESIEFIETEHLKVTLLDGKGAPSYPLLPVNYDRSSTTLAQAVHSQLIELDNSESRSVGIEESLLSDVDQSKPLIERHNSVSVYPTSPSLEWIPESSDSFKSLLRTTWIETLTIQNELIQRVTISSDIPEERKQFIETEFMNCIEANNKILESFKD